MVQKQGQRNPCFIGLVTSASRPIRVAQLLCNRQTVEVAALEISIWSRYVIIPGCQQPLPNLVTSGLSVILDVAVAGGT